MGLLHVVGDAWAAMLLRLLKEIARIKFMLTWILHILRYSHCISAIGVFNFHAVSVPGWELPVSDRANII